MPFTHYIQSGQRKLRCGYTTGTCAALAASGAARCLLLGDLDSTASLKTPKGLWVTVDLLDLQRNGDTASCAVVKDAGDDADVTDGLKIYASVRLQPAPGIVIEGGRGIGRVTKPGLDQPVGAAAINRVPREMITVAVEKVCREAHYTGGLQVILSIPHGEELACSTFNPKLGIEGGLSILGTSGIVEPMSEQALIDTFSLEIQQAASLGARRLILIPGNYAENFLKQYHLNQWGIPIVKCSNFLGEALDAAVFHCFEQILLVGHIGKLVKLAGGIFNTHSRMADGRAEMFCTHAALCGASQKLCIALYQAATADACLALLQEAHLLERVMVSLLDAIQRHLSQRVGQAQAGALLFSNEFGPLGATAAAQEMTTKWKPSEPSMV